MHEFFSSFGKMEEVNREYDSCSIKIGEREFFTTIRRFGDDCDWESEYYETMKTPPVEITDFNYVVTDSVHFVFTDREIEQYFNKDINNLPFEENGATYGVTFVILLIVLFLSFYKNF